MTDIIMLHSTEFQAQAQPDGDPVFVEVKSDDAFECNKITALLKTAPTMYDVLNDTRDVLTACALKIPLEEVTLLDMLEALDLNIQRAIAAAKGGMLQRDRLKT